jgi:general secretion pathway protein G
MILSLRMWYSNHAAQSIRSEEQTMQIRTQRLNRTAFTLVEMLIVVAIIVVLAGIGGAILLPQLDKAKEDADRVQAKVISEACNTYKINNGDYPTSVQQLTVATQEGPALLQPDAIYDRKKQPFQIQINSTGTGVIVLATPGADGPIGNWKKGAPMPQ